MRKSSWLAEGAPSTSNRSTSMAFAATKTR